LQPNITYPVILLTASAAMVISRVLKLGQENAIQSKVVASTSLKETLKNKIHVKSTKRYLSKETYTARDT
jgi:hypothetical protein